MFANLHNYVQINPSLAILSERLQLKQVRTPYMLILERCRGGCSWLPLMQGCGLHRWVVPG